MTIEFMSAAKDAHLIQRRSTIGLQTLTDFLPTEDFRLTEPSIAITPMARTPTLLPRLKQDLTLHLIGFPQQGYTGLIRQKVFM